MYMPAAFREEDRATIVDFMRRYSFATLVSMDGATLVASHVPVAVQDRDGALTIVGHVARANAHWKAFASGETLAIFTGPHAYVSPAWYEERESVPTWNYAAVHAYGRATAVQYGDAPDALREIMD